MVCMECNGDKFSPYPGTNPDGSPDYGPCQRCKGTGTEPTGEDVMPRGEKA